MRSDLSALDIVTHFSETRLSKLAVRYLILLMLRRVGELGHALT